MQPSEVTSTSQSLAPEKSTVAAWVVCLAASLFFFYEFVQMMMFNAINPSLMQAFSVSATSVGKISSAYFYANVLFMFPAGILLDRFSTKKIIISAMILCIIGTLLFSISTSVVEAGFFRFLTGIGGSFPFLCCLRLASRWFPARRLALVSGVMVTVAMLGGVTGQTPMTFLVNHFGWRHALQLDAVLGMIFTAIIFFKVHDYPKNFQMKLMTLSHDYDVWGSIKQCMFNKQNWFFGLYTCLLNLPIMLLGAIWGSLYLTQVFHISRTHASFVTSMIFFGTIFGSPIIGWLSDVVGRRLRPMLICAIIALIIMLTIMYSTHLSFIALLILFFLLGFITSSQVISYPAIAESNPHHSAGSALGLASVLIMLGPALLQPIFGWLMDLRWNGETIHHVPQYNLINFHDALMILPIAFIIGIALTFLAKETFCRNQYQHTYNNKKQKQEG